MTSVPPDLAKAVDGLSEADRGELAAFIVRTAKQGEMAQRTHRLSDLCFKKCVVAPIDSPRLGRAEESCLRSCVDRFLDVAELSLAHVQKLHG